MELPVACTRGSLFHGTVRSLPRIRCVRCNFVNAEWNRDFLDDATVRRCDGATVGRCAGHKGVERVGEGEGGSMVKKTAISQAKSSITSEHTRNTCGD